MSKEQGVTPSGSGHSDEPASSLAAVAGSVPNADKFWDGLREKERRDAFLTDTLSDSLGYQIRQLRRQHGLTIEQLATRADCHVEDVKAAESGDLDHTDLDLLLALAAVFEVGLVARFVSYSDFLPGHYLPTIHDEAQRIEARSVETRSGVRPEGREPDGEADAPESPSS